LTILSRPGALDAVASGVPAEWSSVMPVVSLSVGHWSLTTLWEKLIKIETKVVTHVKAVTFQMADLAVLRTFFAAILDRIGRLWTVPMTGSASSQA